MPPRIHIRPPRREAPININDTWQNVLEPAVLQIFKLQNSGPSEKLSFKVLYDSTYRLVTQGHGRALHRKFIETTHNYLQTLPKLTSSTRKRSSSEEENASLKGENDLLLEQVSKLWQDFQVSLTLIGDIFMYLDRSFCGETGVPFTDQVGKQLFREDIISGSLDQLLEQLLAQINQERNGQLIKFQTLKSVIDMLKHLNEDSGDNSASLYDTKFRNQLITDSLNVYQARLHKIASDPAIVQLRQINEWVNKERQLGVLYLPEETRHELIQSLETETFDHGLMNIFTNSSSSIALWIADTDLDALELASKLEVRGPSRNLVSEISNELKANQREINAQKKQDALMWVEETISLRNKYIKISEVVGQDAWQSSLKETQKAAIGEFTEANNLLALYLDEYLKKNNIPAENVEPALDKALIIYNSLSDRDEFSLIFQRLLARRLLNNSSRSREHEFSWLQRLKEENLNSDSLKFERMIQNIDESRQLFHGSTSIAPGIVPTNVNVLSTHLWPKSMLPQSQYPLVLPPEIANAQTKFEEFYCSVKTDRILKWNYGLSNVDVKIRIGDKSYLASVPLVCMSILSLFSDDETYTTEQIAKLTNIPMDGELERHLKSLYIAPGSELLVKNPPGKVVNATDQFSFNHEFKSSKSRFKIKKVSASKPTDSKSRATSKEEADFLMQERVQKAEAAVVRILKARKEISHASLVQTTASLLRQYFNATPPLIKRAIQNLLTKEYIERHEKDSEVYKYIA